MNITEREHDVIHCLSKGLTNKEIGQQLGISQHTVRDHLSSVFKKLNISSRIELAILINASKVPAHNA
ncbi:MULTISPECIES: response regulator transcription factor [Pseudomonas]|uniref:Helix-turn-helix transcriptional regulator n=1 Tax=Pseudomonas soli TaxID=1306993 RepID=A0ABU7GJX0_9PSED|nr:MULTISPECIES: helix-turn-helix transcriptional regulator [Pseudomonas]AUY33042.1 LuxR family transcriptional regulator [Pseudomonas sp. PONIH3]MDT3713167.1 helix-turn-helix transcriptional regulator [Pseudomonas soli]MDT3730502.1 helix-turn-helix transcriptional regulator [Pseudomonas soli]MEE1879350.1 helix-turn-helix transcriptional regulator [Pseudomonas soli]NBK40200.1 LuxR family transcriptional regulator [Pseudomonas soli]